MNHTRIVSNRAAMVLGLLMAVSWLAACGSPAPGSDGAGETMPATTAAPPRAAARLTALADQVSGTATAPAPDPPAAAPLAAPLRAGGEPAPDFQLPDLDGQTWTLAQFRGKPVMLFYWTSW